MIRFFKKIFNITNSIRVGIFNFLFWSLLIITILVINLKEDNSGETLLIQFYGEVLDHDRDEKLLTVLTSEDFMVPQNTMLKDVLTAIKKGVTDKKINNLLLDMDYLTYVGLGAAEEIGVALTEFKNSGKEISVYSSYYDRNRYYIASFGSNISMDPFGALDIEGISIYRNYWKELLDRYSVDVKIFKAGEYKSYVEPYNSVSMSKEVKAQNLKWMNSIWNRYIDYISKNRNLDLNVIDKFFSDRLALVKKYGGDSSKLALGEGFIDKIESRETFYSRYPSIYNYVEYLDSKGVNTFGSKVGVVTIEGTLTYSNKNPGYVSAIDTVTLLDSALGMNLEGLIIRINSGGGGVFASEIIRRKVSEINSSIPVLISMGDLCASGGYWIATAGSKIYANESTITGSIGVFGMLFGLEKTLEDNFGIHTDGVTTTPGLEPVTLTKNIGENSGEIIQLGVIDTYNKFVELVSKSREIPMDKMDLIAQGRVWSGKQGLELGLVDSIGGTMEAKEFFGNNSSLIYLENKVSIISKIIRSFSNLSSSRIEVDVLNEIDMLSSIKDPKNVYALWY